MMQTAFTPDSATPVSVGLAYLGIFALCAFVAFVTERTLLLVRRERMSPLAALLRAVLQVLVGGPIRLHRRRMAAVAAACGPSAGDRAQAMQRHPSGRGRRHLHVVPNRVA